MPFCKDSWLTQKRPSDNKDDDVISCTTNEKKRGGEKKRLFRVGGFYQRKGNLQMGTIEVLFPIAALGIISKGERVLELLDGA